MISTFKNIANNNLVKSIIFPLFLTIISAVLYFVAMQGLIMSAPDNTLLSSGVAGISLIIAKVGFASSVESTMAIFNIVLNIPLLVISFFFVGKKFSIFTLVNVLVSSLMIKFIDVNFLRNIVIFENLDGAITLYEWSTNPNNTLMLAMIAGIIAGFSAGITFKFNSSGGGMDIVAIYFAVRKGLNSGKYLRIINIGIILIGAVLLRQPLAFFYTLVYIMVNSMVVDLIHIKNKKVILHCITSLPEDVSNAFISNSLHGCTIIKGVGAFSKTSKYFLFIVVSSYELDKVMRIIKEADPNSFVSVSTASLVSGRFYVPPLE